MTMAQEISFDGAWIFSLFSDFFFEKKIGATLERSQVTSTQCGPGGRSRSM